MKEIKRKIFRFGTGHAITIPQAWFKYFYLRKGDSVLIKVTPTGELQIRIPDEIKERKFGKRKKTTAGAIKIEIDLEKQMKQTYADDEMINDEDKTIKHTPVHRDTQHSVITRE